MRHALNLISPQARKREEVRSCLRIWTRIFAAVVCAATLGGVVQWQTGLSMQARLAALEVEYEPVRQLKLENAHLQKMIKALKEEQPLPIALAQHRPLLGLIGLTTQAVAEQSGKIYLQQLEIIREPIPPVLSQESTMVFSMMGISADGSAATQLKDALQSGPFASVDLSINAVTRSGNQSRQTFSIQCTN